ncbi:hypothetical protein QNO07_23265 [Streptomyces sp. 549]|uniref:hypothetical protein n=1 Tax=Streptomyces sp. 549 TaxID=3049076 RepID=UPI0024C2D45D|nr:hypothetical protein [Streptomyces sp. 549]MDK1476304.1 hypothetical protein [Streptomyces sp. 549]
MNALGTIDRPSGHGPTKQDPMNDSTSYTTADARPEEAGSLQNRNRKMQLMPETLSRTRMLDHMREAESERMVRRVLNARRMQKKADRASKRARRALAMAVMQ